MIIRVATRISVVLLTTATLVVPAVGAPVMARQSGSSEDPGTLLWASTYDGSYGNNDYVTDLALSPDGSTVFTTGETYTSGSWEWSTLAYDTTSGQRLWESPFDRLRSSSVPWPAIQVSPDGSLVFVAGCGQADGVQEWAIVAYEASTGTQVWVAESIEHGFTGGCPAELRVTPDVVGDDGLVAVRSRVYVAGDTHGLGDHMDSLTEALDARTGALLWAERHDNGQERNEIPLALEVTPDVIGVDGQITQRSRVIVSGYAYWTDTDLQNETIVYDGATGSRMWIASTSGGFQPRLGMDPDGSRVFLVQDLTRTILAYDTGSGDELMRSQFDVPSDSAGDSAYVAKDLAVDPDGSTIFVTGYVPSNPVTSQHGAGNSYATVAVDADSGDVRWVKKFAGGNASDLEVSLDGSTVVVSGSTLGPGLTDFTLVAYDAVTGNQRWTSSYDGPDPMSLETIEETGSLAISPDGSRAFFAGSSGSPRPSGSGTVTINLADYATLAFSV